MLHKFASRINLEHLPGRSLVTFVSLRRWKAYATALFGLLVFTAAHAQTPIPSPSPTPTPITKTGSILVNNPSTVGRISKWVGVSSNGIGTIGDSVITESSVGTIGIGTNPFSDFKLGVDGGSTTGGIFGTSVSGRGLFGISNSGQAVLGISTSGVGVTGLSTTGPGLAGQSNSNNGVQGSSVNGRGVSGGSFNNIGVQGTSTWSYGVFGQSQSGIGVYGISTNGQAGYFDGRVQVNGLMSSNNLSLNPGGTLKFADNTIQATASNITGITVGTGLTGGGTVGNVTVGIAPGGVNTSQLSDNSVTSAKLSIGAVGSTQLADTAVNTNHLADSSVTSAKLADSAVTDTKISPQSIKTSHLANDLQVSQSHVTNLTADLASKANDSGVVHLAGNETITGEKTFSGTQTFNTVSASSINLLKGSIASGPSALTLRGLTTPQGATGGYLSLGAGNFYYPGGSVTLGAGATAPDYNSAPGPFITLMGTDYSSGGDIMIASGHAYGANTGGAITLNTNGAYAGNNPSPGYISLQIQGNESLRVASNGNVGIGTIAPQTKFHVSNVGGTAGQFDGNVTVNGNLMVTGATNFAGSVSHDSTLTGNGTSGSPLGVVSAPNGVVTTGSYANPSWITSLDGNKLTAGTVVKSINGITDNATLVAGSNVTITPSGNTLTISAGTQPQYNPNQVALLRWYDANRVTSFSVGGSPGGVAFDGGHMWVANSGDNTVSKIRVTDGENLGSFPVGANPRRLAFDGANLWVSNFQGNSVMKLRASDGVVLLTIPTASHPAGLAFDGSNIWVATYDSGTVTKLRATDGMNLGSFAAGGNPYALAFDGSSIWVANNSSPGQANKIRASDGALLGSFTVESFPGDIAFDGSSVWITNTGTRRVTKLRASDGFEQSIIGFGAVCCGGLAFDGTNMWVSGESALFKVRASDATLQGSFPGLAIGAGVAFDGANIWVVDNGSNNVRKY